MTKGQSAKVRIFRLLADGRWRSMRAVQEAGGWRYGARIHEINKEAVKYGRRIVCRKKGGAYQYRMEDCT